MTREEYIEKISEEWLRLRYDCYEYYKNKPYESNMLTKKDKEAIREATGQWAYNFLADAMKAAIQIHIKNHGKAKPPAFRYVLPVAADLSANKKRKRNEKYKDPAKQW